jgi:Ca-activated chloride channel family protein
VRTISPLVPLDDAHRQPLAMAVARLSAGGGTNLGGGLQRGITLLMQSPGAGRQRKVILISDGLANQGVTDPYALGNMASAGVANHFGVSTVGVGYDFNEVLMTTLADYGAGQYYFLDNPQAFARVFEKEFNTTRLVAATAVEIRIPLKDGIQLTEAGGFPVKQDGSFAVIHPGDLQAGQSRKLFLTLTVPTDKEREFSLGQILMGYQHKGYSRALSDDTGLVVACVADQQAVNASIDATEWTQQVLQEDFSRLKDEVADAIRKGEKEKALSKIHSYEERNRELNSVIQSPSVSQNLDQDVQVMRMGVEETFAGKPAEVAEKKKQKAKVLQYESYQVRRDKK